MEPRIQYVQTADGVSVAYWTLGEGAPLVMTSPLQWSHIALEWEIPNLRGWYERLAQGRMLVRYDIRGHGMSERNVEDFSLDALVSDVEAVIGRLDLERVDLVGLGGPGHILIAFAARYPQSVSRLVLWGVQVHHRDDLGRPGRLAALLSLAERDWDLAVESWAHAEIGWSEAAQADQWARFIRASMNQADFLRLWQAVTQFDVTALLPQVMASTLVLYDPRGRAGSSRGDVEGHSRELGSRISNAKLVRLGEGSVAAYEHEEGMRVVEEFLGISAESSKVEEGVVPQGTAVILFADIVDSTALTEEMGDTAFREKARELDTSLRAIIRECSGTPVEGKVLGDGVLAVFTSARQAIECALRCNAAGEPLGLRLHLGIHAGDVIREGNNVFGGAVNIAARIAAASAPGEVLVSDTVRGLARTSAGASFEDRGEQTLKGIAEPQRLFAVRARE